MKSTGLTIGSCLWETVGMAKTYVPKIGDQVFLDGHGLFRYTVATIDKAKETARVKNMTGMPVVLSPDIQWSKLLPLDESQVAARILRAATEE